MRKPATLPTDVPALQSLVLRLVEENDLLSEQLRLMRARAFGAKSETSDVLGVAQMTLFADVETGPVDEAEEIEDEQEPDETKVSGHSRKKPGRKLLPDHLERIEVRHDIDEADKACGCGAELKQIGEEVQEKLEIQPAKAFVARHIRPKYACPACEGVETEGATVKIAAPPAQLLPKTMASATLLACLLTAKYVDGLPFYRQEKQFTRIGVDLSRATMSNWAIRLADRCKPLWEMMQKESRSGPVIQIDETTIQVMREKGRANQQKSYMWVMRGGPPDAPVVIYHYDPSRSGAFAQAWLGDYRGVVQTDGYAGYGFLDHREGVLHAGCLAHVRRKFAEVCKIGGKKRKPGLADRAVEILKKLYQVEKEARARSLAPDDLRDLRQARSKPLLETFEKWLDKHQSRIPPKGALGKAIAYAVRQRDRLRVFLDNGHVAIDNNRVENDIRPFVLGRKNWLFAGKPEGAEASAIWYSLIETAKVNGWEPFAYLTFLFNGLVHAQTEADYEALLPNRTTA